MRLAPTVRTGASVAVFLLSSWLALTGTGDALAQSEAASRQGETERLMRSLTGESDTAFDALMDPCIILDGRRMCPGTDSDTEASEEPGRTDGGTVIGVPHTERAVTWLPGVRGELTTSLALEDRIRERLEADAGAEAVEDAQRLLALAEGGGSGGLIASIQLLGDALYASGRFGEAETQYRRALSLKLAGASGEGPIRLLGTAGFLGKLASVQAAQNQIPQALKLSGRAVRLAGGGLGPDDAWVFYNHARLAWRAQRYDEASQYFSRGSDLYLKFYGEESRDAAYGLDALGRLAMQRRNWLEAVQLLRRAAGIERHALDAGHSSQSAEPDGRSAYVFLDLVAAVYELSAEQPEQRDALLAEAFEAAQWADRKAAAVALSQMAARQAKGTGPLADLLRHQQDLVAEWRQTGRRLADALTLPASRTGAEDSTVLRRRLSDQEREIRQIDERLAADFPDYFALMKPAPLPLPEARSLLSEDEALVMFTFRENDLFVWAASKSGVSWYRAELAAGAIAAEAAALRCGLDSEAWNDLKCAELTGENYTEKDMNAGKPLPFDLARAYRLYQVLFAPAAELIQGKQLLAVPSGPLTQLPLHVLVTAPPAGKGNYKSAGWVVRDHALTVLPAISSLKALRGTVRPSAAAMPMIGFGNPLLDGPSSAYAPLARLARDSRRCGAPGEKEFASARGRAKGVMQVRTRGGLADVSFLRMQVPLPETAGELCAVARDVHADPNEIRLGARATEREVKRLSESGRLAQYRVVHFATHGALAGQVSGSAEPGLLLTPPDRPSEEDDGYLTASEIAGLKLDADWVILSACNTAAGGSQGAEALSGIARAFFYAQARALAVSHWEVNSEATVKLITGAMSRLAADKTMGRAEAMRESMLALINKGKPGQAHPAYWAPFVVVGEGGAGR